MQIDPRVSIGAHIHSLACRVLRRNEAKQRLGTSYKTKFLDGRVLNVKTEIKNNRRYKSLDCLFQIDTTFKQKALPLSSTKFGQTVLPEREPQYSGEDPYTALNTEYSRLTAPTSGSLDEAVTPTAPKENSSTEHMTNAILADRTTPGAGSENAPPRLSRMTASRVTPPRSDEGNTVLAHDQLWKQEGIEGWINGEVRPISCCVREPDLQVMAKGSASRAMTIFDYFMWMFPLPYLSTIVELTNEKLVARSQKPTGTREVLKFFGVLILMARCKFSDRRELWSEAESNILGRPQFGKLMSRNRFESIRSCFRFSFQTDNGGVYTEHNQWELCEGFIAAINEHRRECIVPSHFLCVDESISRWHCLGGAWIGVRSPHYVKLDRKPEHRLEIQNVASGTTSIVLGLKAVKSAEETQRLNPSTNTNDGTRILIELCAPWGDRERIICADSHFASVEAAELLLQKNLKFIGVIKTATRRFPMKHFGEQELQEKGDLQVLRTNLNSESSVLVRPC